MKTTASILQEAENTLFTARLGLKLLQGTDPHERLAGLRNLIVFSRAITNVLQNLRGTEGQYFDEWYQPKVEEMKNDNVANYFYKLRSVILKEGTLDVHSSVSFSGNPFQVMHRFQAPPGAKGFFFGDQIGGCGWEVQIEEGYTEKYYVDIPDDIPGIDLKINLHFSGAPESLGDSNITELATRYLDYLAGLVNEAKRLFLRQ